jgi:hypothetical protein
MEPLRGLFDGGDPPIFPDEAALQLAKTDVMALPTATRMPSKD